MRQDDLLRMLKSDLQIMGTIPEREDYLLFLLSAARDALAHEGVVFAAEGETASADEDQLLIRYAAHLYRDRDRGGATPPGLRFAINSVLVRQAGTVS